MRAIFRICGNESQPGLQLVERLARPCMSLYYVKYTVDSTRIIGYLFFLKIDDDICLTYECMPYHGHKQSVTFYLGAQKEINMLELSWLLFFNIWYVL